MTFTVKVEVPEFVGVPEMMPELPKVRPAGRVPKPATGLHVSVPVPPVAVSVAL